MTIEEAKALAALLAERDALRKALGELLHEHDDAAADEWLHPCQFVICQSSVIYEARAILKRGEKGE